MQKRPLLHVSHNHWRAIMQHHSNLQDRTNLSKILEIHSEAMKRQGLTQNGEIQ